MERQRRAALAVHPETTPSDAVLTAPAINLILTKSDRFVPLTAIGAYFRNEPLPRLLDGLRAPSLQPGEHRARTHCIDEKAKSSCSASDTDWLRSC